MDTFEKLRRTALSLVAAERWKMENGISESTSMEGLTQTTYFGQNKFQEEDEVEDMEIGKIGDKRSIKSCCNCEEKMICYGCGEKGHLKYQCPGTNKPGNGDNRKQEAPQRTSKDARKNHPWKYLTNQKRRERWKETCSEDDREDN